MKITFFSNFLNHHQLPLCKEMTAIFGNDFKFVATTPISSERLKLGYEDMNKKYDFVITAYDGADNYKKALTLGIESDVVIIGSAPQLFIKERLKSHKLTFLYSERIFKSNLRTKHILQCLLMFKNHTIYQNKNLYMLCASAYTAHDYACSLAYLNKTYKWGYFPETKIYTNINDVISSKEKSSIIWVGRLIDFKHPELAIRLAKRLKDDGYTFDMKLIGTGLLEKRLKEMIKNLDLTDCVHMLGAMKPEEVRTHMEHAQIFLFTSDRGEGWGAVLNESMNSACAVVASHAIGSVPFLIKHKENGLIFKNGSENSLYENTKQLLDNPDLCKFYGKNAYETVSALWNAKTAAKRISDLANSILSGEKNPDIYENGPCSKAKILKDSWLK